MLWRFKSGRVCILSRCSSLSHVEQCLPAVTGKFYDFCFCEVLVFCHYGFSAKMSDNLRRQNITMLYGYRISVTLNLQTVLSHQAPTLMVILDQESDLFKRFVPLLIRYIYLFTTRKQINISNTARSCRLFALPCLPAAPPHRVARSTAFLYNVLAGERVRVMLTSPWARLHSTLPRFFSGRFAQIRDTLLLLSGLKTEQYDNTPK